MNYDNGHFLSSRTFRTTICGLFLLLFITGSMLAGGCGDELDLTYDPGVDELIVEVKSGGGIPFPGDDIFPQFQLFGDGRAIKYEGESFNRGIFVQGELDESEIKDLLRSIADTDFFELEDEYATPTITDAVYRQISVNLADTQKTVIVWMANVGAFDAAYDLIMDCPMGETTDYVPEKGYLVVESYPLEAQAGEVYLDPSSEIYALLPDTETMLRAANSNTAVAVDGEDFLKIKKYENGQESRGINISIPEGVIVVYPVYLPRFAEIPD